MLPTFQIRRQRHQFRVGLPLDTRPQKGTRVAEICRKADIGQSTYISWSSENATVA